MNFPGRRRRGRPKEKCMDAVRDMLCLHLRKVQKTDNNAEGYQKHTEEKKTRKIISCVLWN